MRLDARADLSESVDIDSIYMVFCTGLLPLVLLGIALFYSGITQRRSSFTMLSLPMLLFPIVLLDWFIWGYSLCYASSSNRFIGNLNFVVLRQLRSDNELTYQTSRGEILTAIHFFFNGIFKCICAALTFPGCIAERGRILPMLVFLFFWSCIIYNPVTYWFWNQNGWLSVEHMHIPVLDFAGGNGIHIVSGFTTLAYSYILGPRNSKLLYNYRSSNSTMILLGTVLLSIGWCGFIGGCGYSFSMHSVLIFINTILCASVSGITWMMVDYYYSVIPLESSDHSVILHLNSSQMVYQRRKLSMISFSSGIMAGLVVITPGGGYITSSGDFWKSIVFGCVGALTSNLATRLKYFFKIDDSLDIFAIHGIGGLVGSLLTGIFANRNFSSSGGWVEGHWIQLAYQLLGSVVTGAYVFVLSCLFLYLIDFVPGLHLRIDKGFNTRMRQLKKSPSVKSETDSEVTPSSIDITDEMKNYEHQELMGSDHYEFNGEYSMDFMEFIKAIKPEDYIDDGIGEAHVSNTPNDYSPRSEGSERAFVKQD